MLVQTLGLAVAQVFATSLDAFFQLTIMIVILVVGGFALAHFHPFDQEGPQAVQVCYPRIALQFLSLLAVHILLPCCSVSPPTAGCLDVSQTVLKVMCTQRASQ